MKIHAEHAELQIKMTESQKQCIVKDENEIHICSYESSKMSKIFFQGYTYGSGNNKEKHCDMIMERSVLSASKSIS